MHRRTSDVLALLDRFHSDFKGAIDEVPAHRREERPSADRWSVANVVEHLVIVEPRILKGLVARFTEAKAAGLAAAPDTSVIGPQDADRYMNRERRIETSAASQPPSQLSTTAALAAFDDARAATRAFVLETDGLELSAITQPHPVFGPLNLYQWMVFIAGHEGRHALQIRSIGQALSSLPQ